MAAEGRAAYLFLSLLQARTGSSFINRLGELPPVEVLGTEARDLSRRVKTSDRAARAFDELRRDFDVDLTLARLAEKGIKALTLADEDYPDLLRGIPDPPPALFVDGELPEEPCVGIVGSRKSSVTGIEAARELGRSLGERGVTVVSGLALGIDAASHDGALMGGGPTIGVLGCGIDVVYPKSNRGLFEKVRGGGAIVSEYYLGEAPLAWRFPARNRIIAGLCETIVVVEAADKSGALITARHALDSGRDVWAVPGPIHAAECQGSNKLLSEGAGVLWDVSEFVEMVAPLSPPLDDRPGKRQEEAVRAVPPELPENEAAAFLGIGFEPTGVDVIAGRSGIEMSKLLPALAMLELKGYVARSASGVFVRKAGA